jgi:hypothetical protein
MALPWQRNSNLDQRFLHPGRHQRLQRRPGLRRRLLDQLNEIAKALDSRIAKTFVQPTLARRHNRPSSPEPRQRDPDLLRVPTTHAIGDHVHGVAGVQEVQGRLGDADVGFNADEGDLVVLGGGGGLGIRVGRRRRGRGG